MSFEPVFENITLHEKTGVFTEKLKVECKTGVPTESVKKIIFLSAWPYVSNTECVDGGVKFTGKVNFFLCYENVEGEVKKNECVSDIDGLIKTGENMESCRAKVIINKEKAECNLDGLHAIVSVILEAKSTVNQKKEVTYVSGGEGVFCDVTECSHLRSLGEKTTVYPVEDEYELPYPVAEVLSQKAVGTISSCQCGVGTVIVDGEVNISQILLQLGDKKDIIKEVKTIPFRAEIEYEEVMPSFLAVASLNEKSLRTDVTVDEEAGKSVVSASILLSLTGEAFTQEEVPVIKDAFSLSDEIDLVKEDACCKRNKTQLVFCEKITGRTEMEELPVGAVYRLATEERVEIISTKAENGEITVTGTIGATALFKDDEGKIFSRKTETPFETMLSVPLKDDTTYEISTTVKGCEQKILSLSSGELCLDVCFTVTVTENCKLSLVKEIKCTAEKKAVDSAISVYIPLPGETLFPLAKRLNVNPSELILTNKELQFPLSGEERIVIYRQK